MFVTGGSTVKPYEFYTEAARRVSRKRLKKRTNILRHESIASNKNAVFQTNTHDVDVSSQFTLFLPMETPEESQTIVTVLPEDATGHIHMNLRKRTSRTEVVPLPDVPRQKVIRQVPIEDSGNMDKVSRGSPEDSAKMCKVSRVCAKDSAKARVAAIRTRMNLRRRYTCKVPTPIVQKLRLYSGCNIDQLKCLKCNIMYCSRKSLNYHMANTHAETRTFFPCLYCDRTFAQLWGTTRHIKHVHHKSCAQVEKLRPKLKKISYSKSVEELGREMNTHNTHPTMSDAQPTSTHDRSNKRCKLSSTSPVRPSSKQSCSQNASDVEKDSAHLSSKQTCSQNASDAEKESECPSSKQPCSHSDAEKDSGSPLQIVFSSAFSLHVCAWCKQVFGKKNLLDSHVSTCHSDSVTTKVAVAPTKKGRPVSSTLWIPPTNTEVHGKSNSTLNDDPLVGISDSDLKRICAMVDDTKLVCLKCHRHYGTISNLHRHAVRHLGWRRFKCKLCRYTAYNRSEIMSHLHRVHTSNVVTHTKPEIENLILDLEPEKMKRERPTLSRVDLQTICGSTNLPRPGQHKRNVSASLSTKSSYNISTRRNPSTSPSTKSLCNVSMRRNTSTSPSTKSLYNISTCRDTSTSPSVKSSYNISTRRHARTFNTKPYGWPKHNSAVLCTRSGVYRKPVFKAATSSSNSRDEEDFDKKDDIVVINKDSGAVYYLNKCGIIKKEVNSGDTVNKVDGGCAAGVENSSMDGHFENGSNREISECALKNKGDLSTSKASPPESEDGCRQDSLCTTKTTRKNRSKVSTVKNTDCAMPLVNCVLSEKNCENNSGDQIAETKECAAKTKECPTEKNDCESAIYSGAANVEKPHNSQ